MADILRIFIPSTQEVLVALAVLDLANQADLLLVVVLILILEAALRLALAQEVALIII